MGVFEAKCQVAALRNDGAVMSTQFTTTAGSTIYELVIENDGTRVIASGDRCELPPITPESEIVGRFDGSLVYWGRDAAGTRRFVVRSPDGTSRSVPVQIDRELGLELWAQNGRVVSGYRVTSGEREIGYYDEASGLLKPIRRGGEPIGLQLVPGATTGEPPTALYLENEAAVVEQPDPELGFRRIELTIKSSQCPDGGRADRSRQPTGTFRHRTNAVLLRMPTGGLWLAYTDSRGRCSYQIVTRHVSRDERELFARPPPAPPRWEVEPVVERVELVLVPIERGSFGRAKYLPLPARPLHYTGPWQYHPSVTATRARIAIGAIVIDLDPNKLSSGSALRKPWSAPEPTPQQTITTTTTPPPANAPPFPALRVGAIATPLVMSAQAGGTIETPRAPNSQAKFRCDVVPRAASDPKLVTKQIVFACEQSRAVTIAAIGERVAFTHFSQSGYGPHVEIAPDGAITLTPASSSELKMRYVKGKLEFGVRLPRGAPPPPPGWMIYENDDRSVFGTGYERGYELLRGTVAKSTWDWQPAFPGGRTPAKGLIFWPVFLPNPGRDPTIVYVNDPRVAADIFVRTPDGKTHPLPTWGRGTPGNYRVNDLAAVPLAGSQLPIVAAKIDEAIVVAYPENGAYAMRALVGNERFPELAPGTTRNGRCSEAVTVREREELYSPQLFTWGKTAGVAYLSTRIRERVRWTIVPSAKSKCGWLVEESVTSNEVAIARLDATGAREVVRVPAKFRAGSSFHGAALLVDKQGDVLHTIATSYGSTTYTRITP